jgi:hypothetical protein
MAAYTRSSSGSSRFSSSSGSSRCAQDVEPSFDDALPEAPTGDGADPGQASAAAGTANQVLPRNGHGNAHETPAGSPTTRKQCSGGPGGVTAGAVLFHELFFLSEKRAIFRT